MKWKTTENHKGMFGKHHSEETKLKISKANSIAHKGKRVSQETKLKMSLAHKGKKLKPYPQSWKDKLSTRMKGVKRSVETRKKMREAQLKRVKEGRHNSYKGGITPINRAIRESLEYRLWRESVFKRDNYTCVWCGAKSGKGKAVVLNADHIKPFVYFPELRFAIDNGRTLCVDCHKKTDTYGWGAYNNRNNFLKQ